MILRALQQVSGVSMCDLEDKFGEIRNPRFRTEFVELIGTPWIV